ncbi:TPA: alanine--glyoxylate aminotransferase family protein [Candidatus Bathyarchaeota archaeon]|nr:alanine--glyoxylate aminotransferase family protein [Candidatus Bathyarchaeota archaeon]
MTEKKLIMVPGPTNVPDRVRRAMIKPMISHRSSEFRKLYDSLTENMRYLFQTQGDVYILTVSGTGGVECIIGNTVNPGDKIIIPVFGLFSERMKEAIIRRGGEPIDLQFTWGTAPTADRIKEAVEVEKDAKAIAIVYNETSTGVTVRDLPEIGRIAKENDLLLIVDAVSILGGDELPVDKWNIDICVTASQKCLACPPGLALFSISEKAWEIIEETQRPFYFDMAMMRSFSQKSETPFTPAIPLFYALDEALKIIREEGLKKRFNRHKICSEAFYEAIEAIELKPFPEEDARSQTVIAFRRPEGIDGTAIRKIMKEKYNVVIAGGAGKLKRSTLRIGCMGTVSETETLLTINALENALKNLGYNIESGSGIEAARRRLCTED